MARYSKILVPVDLSEMSREVFRQAHDLGRKFDSQMHLLHIVESWTSAIPVPTAAAYAEMLAEQQSRASRELERLLGDEPCPTSTIHEVRVGHAAEEILRYAEQAGIDLIVMGTHGRSGLNRWLLGSVAQKVVQCAPCPVLIVRPQEPK